MALLTREEGGSLLARQDASVVAARGADLDDQTFLRTGDGVSLAFQPPGAAAAAALRADAGLPVPGEDARDAVQHVAGRPARILRAGGFADTTCRVSSPRTAGRRARSATASSSSIGPCPWRALLAGAETGALEHGKESASRTILYGHAVMLRHRSSTKIVMCRLHASGAQAGSEFTVGLEPEESAVASFRDAWFRIMPASAHRSEGERVRVGDDVYFVNVGCERYLHGGDRTAAAMPDGGVSGRVGVVTASSRAPRGMSCPLPPGPS